MDVLDTTTVQMPGKRGASEPFKFEFDRVYKMSSPGRQMFAEVVQPMLGRFLQGFNTTVRTRLRAHMKPLHSFTALHVKAGMS